ncbi:MAG TPA: peptidoglycan-binding domain-containing protein [Mycobacteriales bacterium]|nr:peptidoglycan-binding domain-containing protein [Mycobacteriales bacterium]
MADEPELQKNQSGEWVQYLQQLLQQAGYWPGDANGEFGDELEQAVVQFQTAYGLPADGVVGRSTWDALTGSSSGGQGGDAEHSDEIYLEADRLPEIQLILQANGDMEQYLRLIGIDPAVLEEADLNA